MQLGVWLAEIAASLEYAFAWSYIASQEPNFQTIRKENGP